MYTYLSFFQASHLGDFLIEGSCTCSPFFKLQVDSEWHVILKLQQSEHDSRNKMLVFNYSSWGPVSFTHKSG